MPDVSLDLTASHSQLTIPDSTPDSALLAELLATSATRHNHLCPRQVLGVRLGILGLTLLGLTGAGATSRFENRQKRLITFVETDGCGADGIAVATDCSPGRRTLRLYDFGKVAATLVDRQTETAVRLAPRPGLRAAALASVPEARSRWHAYRQAYQQLPDSVMFVATAVRLRRPLAEIISRPGARAICEACGEEVINEREVWRDGRCLCLACAGEGYYD